MDGYCTLSKEKVTVISKTVLKGKDVRTDDNSLERRSLEMRIDIER